jgi:uracil phosphoribosyltransferase
MKLIKWTLTMAKTSRFSFQMTKSKVKLNCKHISNTFCCFLRHYIIAFIFSLTELQTILRDKSTNRSDFKFYADRLIRLVIEEALNQLPYSECSVVTPTGLLLFHCNFVNLLTNCNLILGAIYDGLKYRSGNCGVSIVRSGEAMEQGLRDCCRSIRIGKILVESDADTSVAKVVYARFPDDVAKRQVLLMCKNF